MAPNFFATLLLAVIQSTTEFLPVSSSAHLFLCQSFGLTEQGIFSDVALHAGTLFAIIAYYETDIRRICRHMFEPGDARNLIQNLIYATLPLILGAIIGIEVITRLRSPIIVGGALIIFGILLWLSDKAETNTDLDLRSMTKWEALCIGMAQMLALVPGVSRSGIVITFCRALGYSRRESTKFSMFLAIPTNIAAITYVFLITIKDKSWKTVFTLDNLCGAILTAAFSVLAIRFLMNWLRHSSFAIFAIYRVALGIFVLYYFLS